MTVTPRAAWAVTALALVALLAPWPLALAAGVALVGAVVLDAAGVRRPPQLERSVPPILSRGVPAQLELRCEPRRPRMRVRQASVPDVSVEPAEDDGELHAAVVARRRGRHLLPEAASRSLGPWGLAAWHHRPVGPTEVRVYPDMRTARRLALGVRQSRFRDPGRAARGPLGLGTDFESIRDYQPDDDIRLVNWRATARVGRPMTNQYRVDQDRDVLCLVDAGRLMAAPAGATADRTLLDAAVDAAAAVALVADELEDRCGTVAFDDDVRRHLRPRRRGGDAVVRALHDLEPSSRDSDYERAFRVAAGGKRALVLALTDLLDESAARSLIAAVPVIARHHAVVVASCADEDLARAVATPPESVLAAHAMGVASEVLQARARVALRLRSAGARVLEAPPGLLASACVAAYLDVKRRARL